MKPEMILMPSTLDEGDTISTPALEERGLLLMVRKRTDVYGQMFIAESPSRWQRFKKWLLGDDDDE